MWLCVDGRPVAPGAPAIPADDPGLLLGWTAFESLAVHGGAPVDLPRHLARLRASCEALRLTAPTEAEWIADLRQLLAVSQLSSARVRLTVTAGGHRICAVTPWDAARWGAPVRAVRAPAPVDPLMPAWVKHGSRVASAAALLRLGVDEILRVGPDGRFTEGSASAVVGVIGGEVWTAEDAVLPSTTAALLADAARALGVVVRREGPPAGGPWDGLYVASVTRGLAPVVALDGAPLAGDEPVGRSLRAALSAPGDHGRV